ncbi:MAG: M20/M25/M40 family metallo-hydrolase [Bacteroidota bacterium]
MKNSLLLTSAILFTTLLCGQTNRSIFQKITVHADSTSQVMRTTQFLSDVYGPRLLGTPQYFASVQWAAKQLQDWGIPTIRQESFDQDYIGWTTEGFKLAMTTPSYTELQAYPLAFSHASVGEQAGTPLLINRFNEIYEYAGLLTNKIVFLKGYYRPVSNVEQPMSSRLQEVDLLRAAANPDPNDVRIGYHSRRSTVDVFGMRARTKIERTKFFKFCAEQGVIGIVEPSNFPYGILHADGNRTVPSLYERDDIKPVASFVLSNEHFGRITRLMDLGITPTIKLQLQSTFHQEPKYNVNLIAEIPGSDPVLKDEIVLIGAHLDSWHAGTGAVDNAANCAVMMEALRLLQQTGLQPKRTVRLTLWGGEEQVFAGSRSYVSTKVGDFETGVTKAEHPKISAYLNLDNGAGMIRGLYLSANTAAAPYFAEYLHFFPKSQTLTVQNANQTDHELFDYFNIPAFQFIQDPLDYISAIHHTNMDTYEYVPAEDQQYNAKLVAYLAYQLANAKERIPRKQFNNPIPSKAGNTTFELAGFQEAKQVSIVADFNNWDMFGTPLYRTATGWTCKLDLPPGRYFYKFIVDGYWTADPATPEDQLAKDGKGHGGLTVRTVD